MTEETLINDVVDFHLQGSYSPPNNDDVKFTIETPSVSSPSNLSLTEV